jgi:hypothetical protein
MNGFAWNDALYISLDGMPLFAIGRIVTIEMNYVDNRKVIVKSVGQRLRYSGDETRGVSKDILSGEQHDRQEITIGNRKVDIGTIKAG